jgi:hypothetical protein
MKNHFTTQGIAAACIAERQPLLLPNAREHQRFHAGLDGTELPIFTYGTTDEDAVINSAYLPIFDPDDGVPMAALAVRDKKKRMAFTRSDVLALASLAKQVCLRSSAEDLDTCVRAYIHAYMHVLCVAKTVRGWSQH